MKDLPLTLTDFTLKPARVCTITRKDGTTYRLTDAQTAMTISSVTYAPLAGFVIHAIQHTIGGEAASTQIDTVQGDGGTFDISDIYAGRFDAADVNIGIINRTTPTTIGTSFVGKMQPVSFSTDGLASFQVLGVASEHVGVFTSRYQPMCRVDLGSRLCGVPILPTGDWFLEETPRSTAVSVGLFARHQFVVGGTPDDYLNRYLEVTTAGTTAGSAPSFSSTVDATTSDGSAVWTTRESWTRWAQIDTVADNHTLLLTANPDTVRGVDNWFNQGVFILRSGDNQGWAYEVGKWVESTKAVTTYLPVGSLVEDGDWLEIYPGCDHTLGPDGCPRFDNQENYQGEAHYLGARAAAATQT